MAAERNPPAHLAYLDGLRALAALWVVLHHAWYQVSGHASGRFSDLVNPLLSQGRLAVDVFIVLSGFCLMLPVLQAGSELRHGPLNFIKRRAWRILPPYFFATALSLLLIYFFIGHPTGTHWDISLPVTIKAVVTHLVLLQDAFREDFSINHVFWSIAVEWRIYFFFPLLVLGWRYLGPIKTTLLGIITGACLSYLCLSFIGASLTWGYLGLFAVGMLGASIAFASAGPLRRLQVLPWSLITCALTVLLVLAHRFNREYQMEDYAVGFWATSLIIMTTLNRSAWHHRLLSFPPLVFVGTFAYSIYLVHAPLLQMLWQYPLAPFQPQPILMFALLVLPGIPVIVGLSWLFFLFGERPFLNKRKRIHSGSPA